MGKDDLVGWSVVCDEKLDGAEYLSLAPRLRHSAPMLIVRCGVVMISKGFSAESCDTMNEGKLTNTPRRVG